MIDFGSRLDGARTRLRLSAWHLLWVVPLGVLVAVLAYAIPVAIVVGVVILLLQWSGVLK